MRPHTTLLRGTGKARQFPAACLLRHVRVVQGREQLVDVVRVDLHGVVACAARGWQWLGQQSGFVSAEWLGQQSGQQLGQQSGVVTAEAVVRPAEWGRVSSVGSCQQRMVVYIFNLYNA